jgi:hypothetical protein
VRHDTYGHYDDPSTALRGFRRDACQLDTRPINGLYFGHASFQGLMNDAMGRPVLSKAVKLLQAVVRVAG